VLQGLLIGMIGAGIGCLTGFALCSWLATLTKADGTMVLPIVASEGRYLTVFALTTLGAVLASVIPARSASRLDPLEAIQQ
jgi:lipoprotein-releasing system permease protein